MKAIRKLEQRLKQLGQRPDTTDAPTQREAYEVMYKLASLRAEVHDPRNARDTSSR